MIDYEKLKKELDDLIEKLNELMQSDPVFKEGDTVYFLDLNKPEKDKVLHIQYRSQTDDEQWYKLESGYICEKKLFKTKLELIQSQIEYWNKLKLEEEKNLLMINPDDPWKENAPLLAGNRKCNHESDGSLNQFTDPDSAISFKMTKCKKCGEFYS